MTYAYLGKGDAHGRVFRIKPGQYIAGHPIGILHLEVWYPLIPGNVVNASTYDFPVRLKLVKGATQERMLAGDPALLEDIIAAGRELEQEGVRAVVGACGYFGNFQPQVAAALDVPVFLSSLLQVPLIHRALKPGQKVGIMCADSRFLRRQTLEACGVTPDIPIAVIGLEDQPEFGKILYSKGEFDYDRLEQEVVACAQKLVRENPEVGAILLECSDLPPFAAAVQAAVELPVFDFITLIRWVYTAVVQKPYQGIC